MLALSGLSGPLSAGASGSVTVTARDAAGNVASAYAGTVALTSSDPHALLPASHAFTAADKGIYTFAGIAFHTVGTQTLTATDAAAPGLGGALAGLVVDDLPPAGLSYAVNPARFVNGQAIAPDAPSSSGGAVVWYSVSPALPAGLALDASTGVLRGTPAQAVAQGSYTVTATNSGGSATVALVLTVADAAPARLAYAQNPMVYTLGRAITPNAPAASGGPISSYAVSPALPAGLALDNATGVLSGTPAQLAPGASYTVTATNPTGFASATLALTVNDAPPSHLSYAQDPATYTKGQAIAANQPSSSGGAAVSYAVSPALPQGLGLDPVTGVLSGTPAQLSPAGLYFVTASNSGGSTTGALALAINDAPPSGLTYPANPVVFKKGLAAAADVPTANGGPATLFWVNPQLPSGLSFNSSSGAVGGTPAQLAAAQAYTVIASNTGGSASATLVLSVTDLAPAGLSYTTSTPTYLVGTAIAANLPSSSGGAVVSYAVSPALPAGLSLSSSGVLSGTPTQATAAAQYTVTASNGGGSTTSVLAITVKEVAPATLSYSDPSAVYTKGTPIPPNLPSVTGGKPTSYSIAPALPAGLSLDLATGILTGTPAATLGKGHFTVTAQNSGGSSSASLAVSVNPPCNDWLAPAGGASDYSVNSAGELMTVRLESSQVLVSCFDTAMQPKGSPVLAGTAQANAQLGPAAVFQSRTHPNALAVWREYDSANTAASGVYAALLDKDCNVLAPRFQAIASPSGEFFDAAIDDHGGFVIAENSGSTTTLSWYDQRGGPLESRAWAQTLLGTHVALNRRTGAGIVSFNNGHSGDVLYYRRWDASRAWVEPAPVKVPAGNIYWYDGATVGMNDDGEFVFEWRSSQTELRAAFYDATGALRAGSPLTFSAAPGYYDPFRARHQEIPLSGNDFVLGETTQSGGTPLSYFLYTSGGSLIDSVSTTSTIANGMSHRLDGNGRSYFGNGTVIETRCQALQGSPIVRQVQPATGPAAGGTTVTLTGANFAAPATVSFGGIPAARVKVVTSGLLIAVTPASTAGAVDVVVRNPGGQSSTLRRGFTFGSAPTIYSADPAGGPLAGGTPVTLVGTNFVSGATVLFGTNTASSVTFISSTQLTAAAPAGLAGAVDLQVVNPNAEKATLAKGFSYNPAPTLSTLAPVHGPQSGGTVITLTGTGFLPSARVTVGGVAASHVVRVDPNTVTAVTPAGASAFAADVVITNYDGQSATLGAGFTFDPPPAITSVSPGTGDLCAATQLTITGAHFVATPTVLLGAVPATNVTWVNGTTLTATTGGDTLGAKDVTVLNPDGQSATAPAGFSYTGSSQLIATPGGYSDYTVNAAGEPATIRVSGQSLLVTAYTASYLVKGAEFTVATAPGTSTVQEAAIFSSRVSPNLLALWRESDSQTDANTGVHGALFKADGTILKARFKAIASAYGEFFDAALDDAGNFVVAENSGATTTITWYDATGAQLDTRSWAQSGYGTHLALNRTTGAGIVSFNNGHSGNVLYYRRWDAARAWIEAAPVQAPADYIYWYDGATVGMNDTGAFVLEWRSSATELRAAFFDAAGNLQTGSPFAFSAAPGQYDPFRARHQEIPLRGLNFILGETYSGGSGGPVDAYYEYTPAGGFIGSFATGYTGAQSMGDRRDGRDRSYFGDGSSLLWCPGR